MYASVYERGPMEGRRLDPEMLKKVSGGWTPDQLAPEERAKADEPRRAIDRAQAEEGKAARRSRVVGASSGQ
jgi:hypothetical protein